MASLPTIESTSVSRPRRWDAVVLGSGIAGLVAAARIGGAGHRVLVVEEEAAGRLYPGLRDPFFLAGARPGGLLDTCLRELTIPLIDRRRIRSGPLSYQVVGPDFRVDIGEGKLSVDELVAWGLAKPDEARVLVRVLSQAADAERDAMLSSPLVQIGRLGGLGRGLGLGRTARLGAHTRGLPSEAARPPRALAPVLAAQCRALSNLATAEPSPEARARLLGSALSGGAAFIDGPPWLAGILRRRVETVYGQFRSLPGDFSLVSVDGQPGVAPRDSREIWLGRVLVIAAPASALVSVLDPDERPDFLELRTARRRVGLHLRVKRSVMPEGMGPRVISVGNPTLPLSGLNLFTLAAFPNPDDSEWLDLVARALVDLEDPAHMEAREAELMDRVRTLFPFAGDGLVRRPVKLPRWDDDGWLEDPPPGVGWPAEIDLRVSSRPPVYRLERAGVAGLGLEGDLLLGWRAGDAIASQLD